MSPRMVTLSLRRSRPNFSRRVKASSSAWVGCSCAPSPALMTGMLTMRLRYCGRAGRAVPDDEHVGVERLDVLGGVAQGLALDEARGGAGDGDHVGAQARGGDFKGHARARAWLEEEVDDGAPAQRRNLFLRAPQSGLKLLGGGKNAIEFLAREVLRCRGGPCASSGRGWGGEGRQRSCGRRKKL